MSDSDIELNPEFFAQLAAENEDFSLDAFQDAIENGEMNSPVLQRLIEEVRNDIDTGEIKNYNRMHNRHNRSGGYRGGSYRPSPEEVRRQKLEDERTDKINKDIKDGWKDRLCSICGKPFDGLWASEKEKEFFLLYNKHLKCAHPPVEEKKEEEKKDD